MHTNNEEDSLVFILKQNPNYFPFNAKRKLFSLLSYVEFGFSDLRDLICVFANDKKYFHCAVRWYIHRTKKIYFSFMYVKH